MRESRTYGSVRGALREKRSYRDLDLRFSFVRLPILDADSSSYVDASSAEAGEVAKPKLHLRAHPCTESQSF